MSPDAVTDNHTGRALFLDVDGTLLEIAQTPQDVRVSEDLKTLLCELSAQLDGALALVSGRSLQNLDALFAPYQFSAAGLHGLERRDALGCIHRPALDPHRLDAARAELQRFVVAHEGVLLEDKGYGLALHFRRAPHLAPEASDAAAAALAQLSSEFMLQSGKCVFEIRMRSHDKGTAIADFMREPPFRARIPVFLGDDLTDENGFAVVNSMEGVSVRVGPTGATLARHELRGVQDVLRWLREFPAYSPPHAVRAIDHQGRRR